MQSSGAGTTQVASALDRTRSPASHPKAAAGGLGPSLHEAEFPTAAGGGQRTRAAVIIIVMLSALPPAHPATVAVATSCGRGDKTTVPNVVLKELTGLELGGRYRITPAWPPPGEMLLGRMRFGWGQSLTTSDPTFSHIVRANWGGTGLVTSAGCRFAWTLSWGTHGIDGATLSHLPEAVPETVGTPYSFPDIDGWQFFQTSSNRPSGDHAIGVWRSPDSTRSRLYAFDANAGVVSHALLAELPFRIGGLSSLPAPDDPSIHFDVFSDSLPGTPTYYVRLVYFPTK